MALCAAWPSLPFINATTDGSATLHKKHTVRLGGAPIEITIKLRLCGAPLRCKGLSYVAVGTYKQFCVGLGEDSGALPIDPATTAYRHGAQCSPTDSDLRASIVYAFRCDEGGGEERARVALLHAGSSVLCGAGSTMCGFVALAFAQTHTFQVFFRMTFATVALALLHALLVFPALLAWFGPSEKEE